MGEPISEAIIYAANDASDEIVRLEKLYDRLESHIKVLADYIEEVSGVINSSKGVAGWHLNGDVATWSELSLDEIPDLEIKL